MLKYVPGKQEAATAKSPLWMGIAATAVASMLTGVTAQASAGNGRTRANAPTGGPIGGSIEPQQPPVSTTPHERITPAQPGQPAIRPQIAPTDLAAPAFTVQDVSEYYRSRGSAATIERVEFVRRSEFPQRYPELHTYAPDDALLCVVTLRGTFPISVPPTLSGKVGGKTGDTALHVFDARTGNLLTEAVR